MSRARPPEYLMRSLERPEEAVARLRDLAAVEREFTNELGREITCGAAVGAAPETLCRLHLYGPDSGIDSYMTRLELANLYVALRELFRDDGISLAFDGADRSPAQVQP